MRAATHRDAPVRAVRDLLTPLHELAQIAKLGRAVGVGEEDVLAPNMPKPVRDGAALAAILLELHHPQHIVQLLLPCKL